MRFVSVSLLVAVATLGTGATGCADESAAPSPPANYADEHLVAWCIVPFDAQRRTPEQRVEMLSRLGLRRVAYDWREEHVATFAAEFQLYRRHGIELVAFWDEHPEAFRLFAELDLHPQIWKIVGDPGPGAQEERVERAARQLEPLARRTAELKCQLGLYNHGGWGGEPQNLAAVCQRLRDWGHAHVGIVYNLHHAHDQLDAFAEALHAVQPYLLCLNLNGMQTAGDRQDAKVLPIGAGDRDRQWFQTLRAAGYAGPIGIIGHTDDDVELRLRDNLDGWHWLLGGGDGPRPDYRTWQPPAEVGAATNEEGAAAQEQSAAGVGPSAVGAETVVEDAPARREYSAELVRDYVARAQSEGDPYRGLIALGDAKAACLSCHRLGSRGASVGPELNDLARRRTPEQIVEAVLWPARQVDPAYNAYLVIDDAGRSHQGYLTAQDDETIVLRDPTRPEAGELRFARNELTWEEQVGTLMPENASAALGETALLDVLRLLFGLGTAADIPSAQRDMLLRHAGGHVQEPADFPYVRDPLHPERWPSWRHPVNQYRIYDFYTKQAGYFRRQATIPPVVSEFPGLDGGKFGHGGNQVEGTLSDARWNDTVLGSVQCGIFRGHGVETTRAVCVQLPGERPTAVCFDQDALAYRAAWRDGFVKFSDRRHGFMDGLLGHGESLPPPQTQRPDAPLLYRGFYRHGPQVAFAFDAAGTTWLDVPSTQDGRPTSLAAPLAEHPQRRFVEGGPAQWPQELVTPITFGDGSPYAVDTIGLPYDNPWRSLMFVSAHAFRPDGTAIVCTMEGDVWRVKDFSYPSRQASWRRIAAGLHQPLGVYADDGGLFVQCRDQLMRLHDLNGDEEIDYYECFSKAFVTSAAGHDFICGLERDAAGAFYFASGNQGLVRISPDGRQADVLATGFRNPDGVGLLPEGWATVPCSEGEWTPASMICAVPTPLAESVGDATAGPPAARPHYGYPGPRDGAPPELPLVYVPRPLDNSSGGQAYVDSDQWGPLQGQLIHTSFGNGTHMLILRDQVDGQWQGAVVPLPGEFRSGAHRARFHPRDGQLYVSGMQGWGSFTPEDGCFHRVRYTGDRVQIPVACRAHENGIVVRFAEPLDPELATRVENHFVQAWNYRYSESYGSPEFSPQHDGVRGHDVWWIRSAHVLDDGQALFLELPELQPVNQVHLYLQVDGGSPQELFVTVHRLAEPFTEFPGYRPYGKTIAPHPLLVDLQRRIPRAPNPHATPLPQARTLALQAATNLSFSERTLRARSGEPLALTFSNPDVVPHNWALVRPGALQRFGELADRYVADPQAIATHYVPPSDDVLAYTDMVQPGQSFTIYFHAPQEPGRYPFLCTFPGHWKLMQGELIVE